MAIIAIDWDRTIHDTDNPVPGRKLGPPLPGAKEALIELRRQGHTIIIHSCARAAPMADWLAWWEIPYSTIWQGNGKPVADWYVDDRGVKFTSWADLGYNPGEW